MSQEITNKAEMYRRLAAGCFGNTIPQYFSVEEWKESKDFQNYEFWGVRSSTVANHAKTRMYVPRDEVAEHAERYFGDGVNISYMVDSFCVVHAWLDVWDSPTGLVVEGVLSPPRGMSWREGMRSNLRKSHGASILPTILNPNSYDDLRAVFERYPGHVVEISVLNRCIGTIPGRNAIVWEVRKY